MGWWVVGSAENKASSAPFELGLGLNVQKLTNLKKKDFLGHKNKMGLSLGKKLGKKLSIKAKNDQFSNKKKGLCRPKKKAGAELKKKKKNFWVKNWEKRS